MEDRNEGARLAQFISLNTTSDRWAKRLRMEDMRTAQVFCCSGWVELKLAVLPSETSRTQSEMSRLVSRRERRALNLSRPLYLSLWPWKWVAEGRVVDVEVGDFAIKRSRERKR